MDWIQRVKVFLNTNVSPDDRLLLAVSGGADSMGMLALVRDRLGFDSHQITVGHVQHGIRAQDGQDLELIREFAARRSVSVITRHVNAPELAVAGRLSLEVAARRLRYEALEEMAHESGCTRILTAHTLDDSAETVWMRMQNGGSWYEWTGIPSRRGRLLRPLVHVSRWELRQWMEEQRVPFREDETNADQRHRRNRLRSQMALRPDIWNDQRKQELAELGEMAAQSVELFRSLARVLPLRFLDGQKPRVIGLAIDAIFIYFKRLKFAPVEAAWGDLLGETAARMPSWVRHQVGEFVGGSGPEAEMLLPGSVRLIRRGAKLWLTTEPARRFALPVRVGIQRVPQVNGTIEISFSGNGNSAKLAPEIAHRPLFLRTWLPGDRLRAPGRPSKKISDLLNEADLNPVEREKTIVLADELGPLMILNGPVDERAMPGSAERKPLNVTWTTHDSDRDQIE